MAEDLVEKVISFFSGDSAEMSDKEIVLRQRLKELAENKYARFFRHKTDEADVPLAQFFYTLYKMILPIRTFMRDVAKTTRLRQIVLEAFMDANIVETVKRLSPAAVEELAKKSTPDQLVAQVQVDIDRLRAGFDANRVNRINRCWNLVMVFFQLAYFDFPGLLKKFDSNFTEGPFGGDPKFSPVKTGTIAKELGDFLAVSQHVNPDNDWKTLLKLLKSCANEDLISETQFAQILIGLRDVINSRILLLLVQYGSKNPVWSCKPRVPDEHIAENWLEARTAKAQEFIDKINHSEKNKEINVLLKNIFEHNEFDRMENYTLAKGEVFERRGLSGFDYAEGMNYLSIFLSDYLEREVQDFCDILCIRGQWTNNSNSKEMSEALHQMLTLPEEITNLDETVADDGPEGSRLKAALLRVDRDKTQARYINTIIENINETAQEMLALAAQELTTIERHLKNLAVDIQKKHPEMIINWKELIQVSREPLGQRIADGSTKIASFIQLMNLCAQ